MMTVRAVFENGVFRPTGDVRLPEHSEVEFEPRLVTPEGNGQHLDRVYAVLLQSFDTAECDSDF
jgi:predicted DNA-binding antitoxin AbrB/MazE fold protein